MVSKELGATQKFATDLAKRVSKLEEGHQFLSQEVQALGGKVEGSEKRLLAAMGEMTRQLTQQIVSALQREGAPPPAINPVSSSAPLPPQHGDSYSSPSLLSQGLTIEKEKEREKKLGAEAEAKPTTATLSPLTRDPSSFSAQVGKQVEESSKKSIPSTLPRHRSRYLVMILLPLFVMLHAI